MMTKVVRHEAWHATQDCMAGTIDNTFTAVILQDGVVPDWIKDGAERTYPAHAAPYEAEAMWAAFNPELVVKEFKHVLVIHLCGRYLNLLFNKEMVS